MDSCWSFVFHTCWLWMIDQDTWGSFCTFIHHQSKREAASQNPFQRKITSYLLQYEAITGKISHLTRYTLRPGHSTSTKQNKKCGNESWWLGVWQRSSSGERGNSFNAGLNSFILTADWKREMFSFTRREQAFPPRFLRSEDAFAALWKAPFCVEAYGLLPNLPVQASSHPAKAIQLVIRLPQHRVICAGCE